jgi:PAS domain-containing protein
MVRPLNCRVGPSEVLTLEMRFSRHVWWLYLALMAPLIGAYLAGLLTGGPVYNVIGFSGVVAMVVGIRVHKPTARWAWYVLALGQVLFVVGDVLAYNYQALFGEALPNTSIADVFYLLCYPVTGVGLLILIRQRNPGRDWASLIDSAVVTIGLALLSWIFLIAPLAHNGALPLGTKLVAIAYPLSDILILGIAVRLAVGTGRRSAAYYMVICALVAVLAADSAYGWSLLHGVLGIGSLLDAGWIAAHLLFGAAALHPSMTTVSQSAASRLKLTRGRILTIAVAALIAPVVVAVDAASSAGSNTVIAAGASIVLFGLVIVRMIGLARAQEAAGEGERTMRLAAEALVAATSQAEIFRAALDAAREFAGTATQPTVLQVEAHNGHKWLVEAAPRHGAGELRVPLSSLPDDLVDQLNQRAAVDLPSTEAVSLGLHAMPVFAAPILVQGQLAGVIALLDATTASNPTRNSVETLAVQVGHALESAALTEATLRTRSEARLSALVQHSTDVILVLSRDTTIEYSSASVHEMLG